MACTANIVSERDVRDYLGIDWEDEATSRVIRHVIDAAASFLAGALGDAGSDDDPRCRHVALAVCADLYDNRSYTEGSGSAKVSSAVRRLVSDFCAQVRLEGSAAS